MRICLADVSPQLAPDGGGTVQLSHLVREQKLAADEEDGRDDQQYQGSEQQPTPVPSPENGYASSSDGRNGKDCQDHSHGRSRS